MSELTREQFEYYLQCMHGNYDVRSMAEPYLKAHDAALRARLAACEKERDEWKRLYAHRGEALKRACLQCGYTQKEMKPHD